MYLLVLFLPLISSLFLLSFGFKLGIKGSILMEKIKILILLLVVSTIVFEIYFNETIIEITLFEWFFNGIFVGFRFDNFSVVILSLIVTIYSIVAIYSTWYMSDDPHIIRFLSYLGLFSSMMIILVISNNCLTMFIGWEGVGLTSYFLINYWFTIIQANKAAIKAIMYNKVGDIFFMLALIITIVYNNQGISNNNFNPFYIYNFDYSILKVLTLSFIIAAMAKSAQFFFDSWLGDAMMGPTPVSALLHAATMVTAGVFLIIRIFPSYLLPQTIIYFGSYIGLLTIILGGFIALFQYDIKKTIAYSTCSQLGYMFYATFLGLYTNSYYHLFIHGFFKALLFLSAGIIIHNIALNQDSRKCGSLIFILPLSYLFVFVGTISIISFPFFSGFFSKDPIIEFSFFYPSSFYFLTIVGAILTISYSFKLFFSSFWGKPTHFSKSYFSHYSEPNFVYFYFLFLIIGSLFLGYLAIPIFFNNSFVNNPLLFFTSFSFDLEFIPLFYRLLPVLILPVGIYIGYNINNLIYKSIFYSVYYIMPFITIFNKRFFFESIYNNIISPIFFNKLFKFVDNGFVDINTNIKRYVN